jgi:hypothetical protein
VREEAREFRNKEDKRNLARDAAQPKKGENAMRLKIALVLLVAAVIATTAHAANGTLKVTSFPGGAEVYVDGQYTGKRTPMVASLPQGDHEVMVQVPGGVWLPDTRVVTIATGNNDLSVTLIPDFSDLEEQVQDQQAQIDSLSTQLATAQSQVIALESDLSAAEATITVLQVDLAAAQGDLSALAGSSIFDLEPFVSVSYDTLWYLDGPHVIFEGTNVHVRSGSGATDDNGSLTGLGNLIVGYNTGNCCGLRTGSHNFVLGDIHTYTSYGGLVAGYANEVSGASASVTGGSSNRATSLRAVVTGGRGNWAGNLESVVSGGLGNKAGGGGHYNWVGGGSANFASGNSAAIAGGLYNEATSNHATVCGGAYNHASEESATVSGGAYRTASGLNDWAAGSLWEDE